MDNLFEDGADFKWVNFVHFCGKEHRDDSYDMKAGDGQFYLFGLEVAIHQGHTGKVSFGLELIGGSHFYHPV